MGECLSGESVSGHGVACARGRGGERALDLENVAREDVLLAGLLDGEVTLLDGLWDRIASKEREGAERAVCVSAKHKHRTKKNDTREEPAVPVPVPVPVPVRAPLRLLPCRSHTKHLRARGAGRAPELAFCATLFFSQ